MKCKHLIMAALCSVLLLTACQNKPAGTAVSRDKENSFTPSSTAVSGMESGFSDISDTSDKENSFTSKIISEAPLKISTAEISDTSEDALIQSPTYGSAVLYCMEDDKWLYRDKAGIRTAPASMTKLLTASVALQYLSPDDIVTVGTEQEFVRSGSSLCYIGYGDQLTVKDLLTGMLLNSGNDAAYTAAVCAARAMMPDERLSDAEAVKVFCDKMNAKAAALGMTNSHFVNPDGWDDDLQYVTADDIVRLSVYALQQPVIREIVGTYAYDVTFLSGETIHWKNTNALLNPDSPYYDARCIGLKTGTTDNAGYCLAAAMQQNGKTYISVVTDCTSGDSRCELTLKLFSLAENNA